MQAIKNKLTNAMFLLVLAIYAVLLLNITYSDINMTNSTDNSSNISLNLSLNLSLNNTINSSLNISSNNSLNISNIASNLSNSSNLANLSIDFDLDGYNSSVDCNDNNASVFVNISGYADFDKDNFTSGSLVVFCTNSTLPLGYRLAQNSDDCNDLNSSINPNATEIFYNGIDDDCSVLTKDEFNFDIIFSKSSYNINETVRFTVISENRSNVNITLKAPNNYYNYAAKFVNQTYPISDNLPSSRRVGEYVLLGSITYKNITKYLNKSINVSNSISLNLDGDLDIDQNGTLLLTANALSGYGTTYTYTWYFGDGVTVAGKTASHTYASPGDYNLIVSVKDSEGNQNNFTYTVTVYKFHKLKILALDNGAGGPISGVTIDIGDSQLVTGNDGYASFIGRRGRYYLTAYKDGYKIYDLNNYNFLENSTLILRMSQYNIGLPVINLYNKTISTSKDSTVIQFSISNSSKSDCVLYKSSENNWWTLADSIKGVINSQSYYFNLNISGVSDLKYKIECTSLEGNIGLSDEGLISKNENSDVLSGVSASYGDIISDELILFDSLKLNFENSNTKEKGVFSLLGYDLALKDAERLSSSIERDIQTINEARCPGINCGISSSEKEKRIIDLIKKVNASLNSIPISLKVNSYDEFVKYPSRTDIESVIKSYFDSKGKILTKSQLKSLIEKNSLLQSKLTVSAKIYYLDIVFSDGKTKQLTLIKKELDLYDAEKAISDKNFVILEDARADGASDIKLNFISKSQRLKSDNLFEIPVLDKSLVYSIDKKVDLAKLKLSNTIILSTSLEQSSQFTGFSILTLVNPKDNFMYILIAIIVIVILIRMLAMFGFFSYLKKKLFSKDKEYHELVMLINDAKDYLDAKDIQKASLVYKEIKLKYETVADVTREKVYSQILELCEKLDEEYLKTLIEVAKNPALKRDIPSNMELNIEKIKNIVNQIYFKLKDASKLMFENDVNKIKTN